MTKMVAEPRVSGRRPAHSARAWSQKIQVLFYGAIVLAVALLALTLSVVRSAFQAGAALPQARPSASHTGAQPSQFRAAVQSVPPIKLPKPVQTATKSAPPKTSPAPTARPASPSASARPVATSPPSPRIIGLPDYQKAQADYAGDQVIYYFDAPWCPTCRAAVADFNRNKDKIPQDVVIVLADFDTTKDLQRRWGVTTQSTAVTLGSGGAKDRAFWAGSLRDVLSQA